MLALRVRALARQEIEEAFDWYRARSPSTAEGFLDAVDAAFLRVMNANERCTCQRSFGGSLRSHFMNSFASETRTLDHPSIFS